MQQSIEVELVRIFVGENDKFQGRPLYEVIVHEAHRLGLAGATVLRGTLGFGASSRIHSAKFLRLSEDLPMVIEIIDQPERIAAFLPELDKLIGAGLITLETVKIITYRRSQTHASTVEQSPEERRPHRSE